jgi:hypothetical protein
MGPAEPLQSFAKRLYAFLARTIDLCICSQQNPNPAHSLALLRTRHCRPRCRAAGERDELAPSKPIELHLQVPSQGDSIMDWRASRQGFAAVRDFDSA